MKSPTRPTPQAPLGGGGRRYPPEQLKIGVRGQNEAEAL